MSNNQIFNLSEYSLAILILIIVAWSWHLSTRVVFLERKHIEPMSGRGYGYSAGGTQYLGVASDSLIGSQPGATAFDTTLSGSLGSTPSQGEGFFSGREPPVFYDIGSVRDVRQTRAGKPYLTDMFGREVYNASGSLVFNIPMGAKPLGSFRMGVDSATLDLLGYQFDKVGKHWRHKTLPVLQEGMWSPVDGMSDAQLMATQY